MSSADGRLPVIIERLKGGGALTHESKALGFTNNHILRAALRQMLGREQYAELMKDRVGRRPLQRVPGPKPPTLHDDGAAARGSGVMGVSTRPHA